MSAISSHMSLIISFTVKEQTVKYESHWEEKGNNCHKATCWCCWREKAGGGGGGGFHDIPTTTSTTHPSGGNTYQKAGRLLKTAAITNS